MTVEPPAASSEGPPRDTARPPAESSLGRTAARGAAITSAAQILKAAIQLGGIVVLARLLDPSDYGLLAMVVAIIGFGEIFRDFGLSSAAVQARTLSVRQRDNLFWINTGIGAFLTLLVAACAGLVGGLYDEPRVVAIAQALAATFLLNGMATQHRADLNRRLMFGRLAAVDIGSQIMALVGGVAAALAGAGYWALVAQQLTQAVALLVLLGVATRWLPRLPHRGEDMRGFLRFGGNLMATQAMGYVSRNVDSVVIGRMFGAGQLGVYNRAFQLLLLPLNQIHAPTATVALPVLSRLQDSKQRYDAFLLRGQTIMLHVVVAVFAYAVAQAGPLILLVLGDQWEGSISLFQILAVGGIFQTAAYATYWVFLSKGLTGSNLRFSLLSRPFVITSVLVGAQFGVHGVATGYTFGLVLLWPFGLWWVGRASDAPVRAMLVNGVRALLGYGVAGLASFGLTRSLLGPEEHLSAVLLGAVTMAAALAAVVAIWPAFRKDVRAALSAGALLREGKEVQRAE